MSKVLVVLGGVVTLLLVAWITYTVSPKEKVIYKDKPQAQHSWCELPLGVGTKGSPIKGDLAGIQGVVAGKINDDANCAYYVKFTNKDIWNGNGVHYQSVNASNFVEVQL